MKEFFLDPSGQLSMMRALSALIIITSLSVWALTVIKTGNLIDIPENVMYLNGAALLGKAVQKGFEKPGISE